MIGKKKLINQWQTFLSACTLYFELNICKFGSEIQNVCALFEGQLLLQSCTLSRVTPMGFLLNEDIMSPEMSTLSVATVILLSSCTSCFEFLK